jgi:predicted nucleic acid-binding protein
LAGLKTKFINLAGDTPASIRGIRATLPTAFNEAILLSLESGLRTLDLIHLAAGRHAKRMNGSLGAFVTGDKEFLEKEGTLRHHRSADTLSQ